MLLPSLYTAEASTQDHNRGHSHETGCHSAARQGGNSRCRNLLRQEQYQALYNWATISPMNLLASLALASIELFFMLGAIIVILVILALAFNNLTTTTKPEAAGMTLEDEQGWLFRIIFAVLIGNGIVAGIISALMTRYALR